MEKQKFLGPKYVLKYAKKYHSLPWYGKDLMRYFDYLDQKDMADDPDHFFEHKKVIF